MPLDLPPPVPPQQTDVATLQTRYAAEDREGFVVLNVGDYRLFISGNTYLSVERIREITAPAKTPSQAILLLNALYRADDHLFVNVTYGREPEAHAIYVHVHEGYLAEVDAPAAIQPFFEPFEGERGVTETGMEPQRILAEIKSERAGYTLSSRYSVDEDNPEAFKLIIDGREDPDHQPIEFTSVFGNPGNRFLGRYFGFANLKAYTPGGDQFTLGYGTALTGLGDSRGGENYDRYKAGYNTVTTYGLYGLSGSYTEYEASGLLGIGIQDREQAEIVQGGITGNQFLYADSKTRVVLEESLKYVDSSIEITEGMVTVTAQGEDGGENADGGPLRDLIGGLLGPLIGNDQPPGNGGGTTTTIDLAEQSIQDETYGTARLGTSISHSWKLFDSDGNLSFGVGYKQGIGGEVENTLTDPERTADFGLYDAEFKVSYRLPGDLITSLKIKGQHADGDRVPQQQQWVLGGPDNLSAFLPGILLGDTGAYGRFQIQLPRWTLFTRPFRFSLFVEGGSAAFEGDNPPAGRAERETATDAGIKLEFSPIDSLTLTAHAADSLSTNNIPETRLEDAESDFYFNIKAQF